MPRNEKTILLISSESWGQNFVSKHHYASYLSEDRKVYFLNPPSGFASLPFGNMKIRAVPVSENLEVISYRNLLPKLDRFPLFFQRWIYKVQAQKIRRFIGNIESVWSFDPFRFMDQKIWKAEKYLYFAMDQHGQSSFEHEISQTSDLIFLVSDFLRPNFKNLDEKVHVIGHGADIAGFERLLHNNVVLLGKNKLKAGLTGNFNNNVDYALIKEMAVSNPEVDFIFIGPYQSNNLGDTGDKSGFVKELRSLGNVFFMGSIPSRELQKYLKVFDINLVLYKEANRDINFNPHKLMAYFYAGKTIVSSWLHAYEDSDPNLIEMGRNKASILELIERAKNDLQRLNSDENQQLRRNFAVSNSYASKIKYIYSLLDGK